jgi:hypothetical protein
MIRSEQQIREIKRGRRITSDRYINGCEGGKKASG